ncbi:MAG: hypothetical protein PVG15_11075 [Desulfobacterales bacterium]
MSHRSFDLTQPHVKRVWGNEAFARSSSEVFAHGPTIYRAILSGQPYPVSLSPAGGINPIIIQSIAR